MTPEHYCIQKISRASSFYYAVRYVPEPQKTALYALHAFSTELHHILERLMDPMAALPKLNWWRDEIRRTFQGKAMHPVSIALQKIIPLYGLTEPLFITLINGIEMDLQIRQYVSWNTLQQYCQNIAGSLQRLTAQVLGYHNHNLSEYSTKLGLALQYTQLIAHVGTHARKRRIYLPQEGLKAYHINIQDSLLNYKDSSELKALLTDMAFCARNWYQEALACLDRTHRISQKFSLIVAEIELQILDAIEEEQFAVMQQHIDLTPVRKMWIAWRTHRKLIGYQEQLLKDRTIHTSGYTAKARRTEPEKEY
jgi:phytoene synthase